MELIDLFHSKLDKKRHRINGISIDSLNKVFDSIECNLDFFEDIPLEDMPKIFDEFIDLLLEYYDSKVIFELTKSSICKTQRKQKNIKPSIQIKKLLSVIENYQSTMEKYFSDFVEEKTYTNTDKEIRAFYAPKEIGINYTNNQKIIEDLKSEKFKIIPRTTFYDFEEFPKNKLKTFLKELRKQYNLKKSVSEKQLIDSI